MNSIDRSLLPAVEQGCSSFPLRPTVMNVFSSSWISLLDILSSSKRGPETTVSTVREGVRTPPPARILLILLFQSIRFWKHNFFPPLLYHIGTDFFLGRNENFTFSAVSTVPSFLSPLDVNCFLLGARCKTEDAHFSVILLTRFCLPFRICL